MGAAAASRIFRSTKRSNLAHWSGIITFSLDQQRVHCDRLPKGTVPPWFLGLFLLNKPGGRGPSRLAFRLKAEATPNPGSWLP